MILQKKDNLILPQRRGMAVAKRAPVTFQCKCGLKDLVGLPRGVGFMEWSCGDCKKRHRLEFAGAGGNTFEKLTEL